MSASGSRPALHIGPGRGWLNDPNGVTRHNGRWHVFFQHNPAHARHGSIHWGHVSSADLATWTEHPVAFGPRPGAPDSGGCWSGSFLSGWGRPAVAYTGVVAGPERSTICVRHALDDDLETWSEPVVVAREPTDVGVAVMRDPYPFRWGGRRFALVGAGLADGTPAVLLFSCDDPQAWRFETVWLTGRDPVASAVAAADVWECPQLVRVGGSDVLVLSLWVGGELEDVVYLLGAVNGDGCCGGLPRFVPRSGGLLDEGPDFYAAHLVDDGQDQPLLFGWIRQEGAREDAPPDDVAGCLTLPRRLSVRGDQVAVAVDPAVELLVSAAAPLVEDPEAPCAAAPHPVYPLPPRARATTTTRGTVTLLVRAPASNWLPVVALTDSPWDLWVDGEVVEVFRAGSIASTIRQPGATGWALSGSVDPETTTVRTLAAPTDPP